MSRVASLGMYDLPPLRQANDRLWTAIAVRLRKAGLDDVPDRLDRDRPLADIWDDPALLLAQTCGYPLTTRWRDRLTYVATPVYDGEGCEGYRHRSRFVVHRDVAADTLAALARSRAAVNAMDSNTGMNLLRHAVAPFAVDGRFFSDVWLTGSHAASLDAVATGVADVAAIDAVTFDHLARHDPALTERTRTIGWSTSVPNLPFVTALATPPAVVGLLRQAIADAIQAEEAAARTLRLRSIAAIGLAAYDALTQVEQDARRLGYPDLT